MKRSEFKEKLYSYWGTWDSYPDVEDIVECTIKLIEEESIKTDHTELSNYMEDGTLAFFLEEDVDE